MKRTVMCGFLFAALFIPKYCRAQEKSQKEETESAAAHLEAAQLKVQIVFSEYEGEKKTKSLPYTLLVVTSAASSKIRMGDRLPIATGKENGSVQFEYIDVGTSIDCQAVAAPGGRFRLTMKLERSWVQGGTDLPGGPVASSSKDTTVPERQFHQPTIRQFRTDSNILLRDGQSIETNFATDPISGKVVKLEVSLTVLK